MRMNSKGNPASGMWRVVAGILIAYLLLLAPNVVQAQNVSGSIRGTVLDNQGGSVAGAEVKITSPETDYSRVQNSDSNGAYAFQSLPLGRYTLSVTRTGFKAYNEKDIILHVDDNLTFDVRLELGAPTETMEVTASENQVEPTN